MLAKMGHSLVFLSAFVLWTFLCVKSAQKAQIDLRSGKRFLANEVTVLVSLCGFFGLIYLLSGFWDAQLVFLFVLASHAGILLQFLLAKAAGSDSGKHGQRVVWAAVEAAIVQLKLAVPLQAITALAFLAYPVVGIALLMRHPWGSEELMISSIRYSLLMLILSSFPAMMVMAVGTLASRQLDEATRRYAFINQLSGMIPNALMVALAVWAFSGGGAPVPDDMPELAQTLSIHTLIFMMAFFATFVLLPYLIGMQRAWHWRALLLEKERTLVKTLGKILKSPTPAAYADRLQQFRDMLAGVRTSLIGDDRFLSWLKEVRENPDSAPPGIDATMSAIAASADLDSRMTFVAELDKFDREVEGIASSLQAETAERRSLVAAQWAVQYDDLKLELAGEIAAVKSARPISAIAFGTLVTTVISGAVGEVGKAAWQLISHAAA